MKAYLKSVKVLFFKDFKQLFFSPMFLFISGLCTVLWSYVYPRALFQFASQTALSAGAGGGANIHYAVFLPHVSLSNLVFLFIIPAITMRLLAEEKKQKTYDLLLTAPITSAQIVVGKFLAASFASLFILLLSLIYPLTTGFFGNFNYSILLMAYLGLFLIVLVYIAIGLFSSSLTESVVASVVMALIFNISVWFISQGAGAGAASTNLWSAVLEYLSLTYHLTHFIKGTFATESLVFFLILISLFLFLTERIVESSRWR